ncbi:MAG TPA: HlyD family efflux transporter periplasmic adaptor subunit [Gammaproteobacteria bacterium]|nr:HlyD family efflux transporter periplasmic adaptor subunit [Gammaproteobacteria bacterium]
MKLRILVLAALTLGLAACANKTPLPLTGTLERDRMELVAEAQEPIVQIAVHEGDQVKAGQVILQLDGSEAQARVDQAKAARDEAAAHLPGADATFIRAQKDYDRSVALVQQHTRSQAELDQAREALDNARAARNAASAALAQAQAALDQAKISLDRLTVRAPRDATVDSLPYHLGERPPARAVVAVLLDASGAYAQVYIPEPLRARALAGTQATLTFDGVTKSYPGTLRFISQDASFTPYYSLTERDRSRLAYLAKVYLRPGDAAQLPSGTPVSVDFPSLH